MTRRIRLATLAVLLVLAVVAAAIPAMLPPPAESTPPPRWQPRGTTVRGAYHIHSIASDGTGSVDEIAAAASRAGLQFIVLTDHGDGTRPPSPPRYVSGVLVVDAVEINTANGHLVALGLTAASPYPLAGTARAVLEDVRRMGGLGIAAHPGSPRASLAWSDRHERLDGWEWLNADSEWRDELLESLGRLMLTYALRPSETLAATLDRPDGVLRQWDERQRESHVIGLAGADAHARLGLREQEGSDGGGWRLAVPSYEAAFRTFSTHVIIDGPLTGDAANDATRLLDGLRRGRVSTVVDGLATPGAFEFSVTSGAFTAAMGEALEITGPVAVHARTSAPPGTRLSLLRDGALIYDTEEQESRINVMSAPGVYRVELYTPGAEGGRSIPWLASNPIYVGMREIHGRAAEARRRPPVGERGGIAADAWTPESSPGAISRLAPGGPVGGMGTQEWVFSLPTDVDAPYAAIRFPIEQGMAGRDRVLMRLRADRPMRLSVQLRASTIGNGERWGETVYAGPELNAADLFIDDMVPLGPTSTPAPPLDRVDALLLVVDTLNTRPGTTGKVQIAEIWLGSAAPAK